MAGRRPANAVTSRCTARAAVLATAVLLGASCGGDSASGVTTLRLWGLGREGEVVEMLVRDFERENPDIRVHVQQIPWTAAHEKLLTAHVGDASPDLAQLGNTWVPEFEALGALEPLDAYVASSGVVDAAGYFRGIWDTNVIDDTTYGIPWYVDTRLIFYRKDILADAGYDRPPGSWAEWRTAMERVKARVGPDRYAIYLPSNEWTQPVILGLQAGSPLLKDDGQYGAFSDSAFRRAFEFYIGLYRSELAPALGLNDVANVYQEFTRGLFAMWITGPWNIGELKRRLPPEMEGKWGTAPLPGPTGDSSGVSLAGGASLVLFRSSQHKPEAWRLIEFLSRPEQQRRFYHLTGDLPARKEAWQDSTLIGDEYVRAFWEQLQRVSPTPKVPEWELIATKVFDYAEQSIRGGVPEAEVLRRLDADVNRILEKRRWMVARERAERGAGAN